MSGKYCRNNQETYFLKTDRNTDPQTENLNIIPDMVAAKTDMDKVKVVPFLDL